MEEGALLKEFEDRAEGVEGECVCVERYEWYELCEC